METDTPSGQSGPVGRPSYRQALTPALANVQPPTVIFLAQGMYSPEVERSVAAERKKRYPDAQIIPVPTENAQQFILDQVKKLAAQGRMAQLVFAAHGKPNGMSFSPGGGPQNMVNTLTLLDGLLDAQNNLRQQKGDPQFHIAGNIKFDSCLVLSDITTQDIAHYRQAAIKLGSSITASASREAAGDGSGDLYTFMIDGSIIPNGNPQNVNANFKNEDAYFSGFSPLGVESAAASPTGVHLPFSDEFKFFTEIINRENFSRTSASTRTNDAGALLQISPKLPLRERLAACYQASVIAYANGDEVMAQKAADTWAQNMTLLPPAQRLALITNHDHDLHDISKARLWVNQDVGPIVQAKDSVVIGAQREMLNTAKPPKL